MRRVNILIADDHTIVREGLVSLLKETYEVVGAVGEGEALVDAAKRLRPDVIVTDMSMPGLSGIGLRHVGCRRGTHRYFLTLTSTLFSRTGSLA